jgi:CBS domain-containing protein
MNSASAAPVGAHRVRDIMKTEVVSVRPDTTVRELVKLLAEHRIGGVPVLGDQDELVGIVTATDLVRLAADAALVPLDDLLSHVSPADDGRPDDLLSFLESGAWGEGDSLAPVASAGEGGEEMGYEEYQVRDLMRAASYSIGPDASIEELAHLMLRGRVHRTPVIDHGRLVGIVTTFDVLRAVAGEAAPTSS